MPYSIYFILVELFEFSNSQWRTQYSFLSSDEKFTYSTGSTYYQYTGQFVTPSVQQNANFITCTIPNTSYITLTQTYPSVQHYQNYQYMNGDWVSMDLFFQGTWSSHTIQIIIGSFTYSYTYTSPTNYPITNGFCDSIPFEVKTLNFTIVLASSTSSQIKFISSNANSGLVSLKNINFSRLQCYQLCISCTGSKQNECTSCYYGSPTNNICPPCPSNQYYQKNYGCNDICDIDSQLYSKGFCQNYQTSSIEYSYITLDITNTENLKWSLIYDQEHLDTSPTIININNQYIYGVFKFNSGIYRYFNKLTTSAQVPYLIGLKITIVAFNEIPINCGIQFKINNTYFGSIYRNTSGIQTHKLKIFQIQNIGSYLTYSSSNTYYLITYVDIPKHSFIFSAKGNYTDNTSGWGMYSIQITSGYCHKYCSLCEVSFKCNTCYSGYYFYRDGSCINGCSRPYQRLVGSYCYDYDDETPYSQYLVQEYIKAAADPGQYAQYTLISQNGANFLKGSDIYYSYQNGIQVFGGPFVWAQAKFQRIHNIISPHHSVTIAFYILYGPTFPSNGQFFYTIETNAQVSKSSANFYSNYPDGSKYDIVYEKISHNINTLTITWECFGPNNEPIKAYCGFYNYYIAVHNCQPYCLQCSDQSTCTLWNSTYDANIIKFTQAQCSINQYYDKDSVRCLDCPLSCLTCTSKIDCQTCQSTYTQTKLGCICKMNQYEDSNKCSDCPIECNQCLSSTYCIECLNSNYRQLSNGQCNCMNGYYPIVSNPQCQVCHQFCKTCDGPTSDQCLTCNDIVNIEKVGTTCKCSTGKFYYDALKICSSCHSSCQTCFKTTNDGCLTCDDSLNRILKGLQCVCKPSFYELNNICTNCPNTEDSALSQCYKLCNNNQQIWHTITCNSCDIGFRIVLGECQPICGDQYIKGYEQCEDNNTILNDLCYNCQFQCPFNCLTCGQSTTLPCLDICGDGIMSGIEECEDGNVIEFDGCFNCKYQCQPQCTKCIKGQCFECSTPGWFIDPTVTPWQCKEKCGDILIVGSEQCDDGNLSDTDGCKDCRNFCRNGCSSCNYTTNTCLSCELPGFIPTSYYCQNVCGDGLVVTDPLRFFSEECDDGNTIDYDGCSGVCQFQCQASHICLSCISNRCESCVTGYSLSNNKICVPICGDSILVASEQCYDPLPYKGCQNCKPKCQTSCLNCDTTGLGCLSCISGYNKIDYLCYSICGDYIITEDEQCDDGNIIFGDGCHFCLFSCQDSCLNCIKGVCYDCQEGYELIQSKCYSICGDGVQKHNEQCEIISSSQTYNSCKSCQFACDLNCYFCQFGICQQCKNGYEFSSNKQYCIQSLYNNSIEIEYFQQQIGRNCIQQFDGCNQYKYECDDNCTQCIYGGCFQCSQKYNLVDNTCQSETSINYVQGECQLCCNGYFLNEYLNCIKIDCEYDFCCTLECGNGIIEDIEQCDDSNLITDDSSNNYCQLNCDINCTRCIDGVCFECKEGWKLGLFLCIPICGDLIVVGNEECDDGNQIPFDGCFQCKYQCTQYCKLCSYGVCTHCFNGYYLDIVSNSCNSVCGDKILASDEDCDDGNELGYDGCFQCKFQFQMECLDCQFGKCILCESPLIIVQSKGICEKQKSCNSLIGLYYDNYSNDCLPLCGDGIVGGKEQCDDQNSIPYDGCYECQYQCHKLCKNCQIGQCFECQNGYYLNEQQCITKCGDGIKIGDEQCDDHNKVGRDGCTFCKIDPFYKCEEDINLLTFCYKCQDNCEDCKLNRDIVQCLSCKIGYFLKDNACNSCSEKCEECVNTPNNCTICTIGGCKTCDNISGFYLDKQLKSCVTKCGDNIIAGNEQCDDGNKIDKDGCNSKQSICYVQPKKQIGLAYSNSTTTSDLNLIFEDLKMDGICDKLKIWIEQFQPNEFQYKVSTKEIQKEGGQGSCEIHFNFFKTILESNLIHLIVPLKENVTRILEEATREIIIAPRRLIYYNQDQKAQAQSVVAASSNLTFLLQLIGPLTIILGGFNFFWTILDILTWANNFYFLNIDYPLNVKLFFNQLEWGDIINIPDIITLNSPDDPYYFEAPSKFVEKNVNPLFLNNIQLFFGLILLAILGYIVSICIVTIIQSKYQSNIVKTRKIEIFTIGEINKSVDINSAQNSYIKTFNLKSKVMPYLVYVVYKETLQFKENFRAKLLQIIGLVFLDICLACALQLQYRNNQEYAIIKLNIFLAIVGVIFILLVFKLYSFVCSQHQILYESKKFKNYYSSLYDGINTKKLLGRNYCYVNLIRKAFFIFFTVCFYEVPLLQTSLCCLICFQNLALVLYQNPFKNRRVLLQTSIPDFCIFSIIFITVLLAIHDISDIFSSDQKYFIGWIILFFIGFSIFIQMIFLLQQVYGEMKGRLIQLKGYICKQHSKKN